MLRAERMNTMWRCFPVPQGVQFCIGSWIWMRRLDLVGKSRSLKAKKGTGWMVVAGLIGSGKCWRNVTEYVKIPLGRAGCSSFHCEGTCPGWGWCCLVRSNIMSHRLYGQIRFVTVVPSFSQVNMCTSMQILIPLFGIFFFMWFLQFFLEDFCVYLFTLESLSAPQFIFLHCNHKNLLSSYLQTLNAFICI